MKEMMNKDNQIISKPVKSKTRAYVLIDTNPGSVNDVVRDLKKKGIRHIDIINGPHNAIALIKGNSPSEVAVLILNIIRKQEGVKEVTVYLVDDQKAPEQPSC